MTPRRTFGLGIVLLAAITLVSSQLPARLDILPRAAATQEADDSDDSRLRGVSGVPVPLVTLREPFDSDDDEATTRPHSRGATAAVSQDVLPDVDGMSKSMVRRLIADARRNPEMARMLVRHYPQLGEVLSKGDPATMPASAPTVAALREAAAKRRQAQALVDTLAKADEAATAQIEKQLLALGEAAVTPLKLAEMSSDFDLRRKAQRLASRLRWRRAASASLLAQQGDLVEIMSGQDRQARATLVDAAIKAADAASVPFLAECLADPQPYVRQQAIEGLVVAWQKTGERDSDSEDNSAALSNATKARKELSRLLVSVLKDDSRNIRLLAVGAAAKTGAVSVDALAELLDDESIEVRTTVIKAMGFSRDSRAQRYIVPLLDHPQWRLRAAALEALGTLVSRSEDRALAQRVMQCLSDSDGYVRGLAVKLLASWNYAPAGPVLFKMAMDGKIPERAAMEALATLKDPQARSHLLKQYDAATDAARKSELLAMADAWDPDAEIDRRLGQAIKDDAFRKHWPQLVRQAGRRERWQSFFATLCMHLESPDDALATAAWESLGSRVSQRRLPADVQERLMASSRPDRPQWALFAAYHGGDGTRVLAGLAHADASVVRLALGMIAARAFEDNLGQDFYVSRSSSFGPESADRARPPLPAQEGRKVAALLTHADPQVRLMAAVILFRTASRSDATVKDILHSGLKSGGADRSLAITAIVDQPQEFLADFDIAEVLKNPQTSEVALQMIAKVGPGRYLRDLMDLAEKAPSDSSNSTLMWLLLSSGDERAMDVVFKRLEKSRSYTLYELTQRVALLKGPGAVRFIEWALSRPDVDYRGLIGALLQNQDPSAVALLKKILSGALKVRQLAQDRSMMAQVRRRLAELDPQGAGAELVAALSSKTMAVQDAAVESILSGEVSDALVPLLMKAIDALGKTNAPVSSRWGQVVAAFPEEAFRKHLAPALNTAPAVIRQAAYARLARVMKQSDLAVLLTLKAGDTYLRENLAMAIATACPDAAPAVDLAKVPPDTLAAVLSAAANWRDGRKLVEPYLDDPRAPVAAGALAAMAYSILVRPGEAVSPRAQAALVAGVNSRDVAMAHLAAQALSAACPDVLRGIAPGDIPTTNAMLEAALAHGDKVPEGFRRRIGDILRGPALRSPASAPADAPQADPVAINKALLVASRSYHPSYLEDVKSCRGRIPHVPNWTRFVVACGDAQLLIDNLDALSGEDCKKIQPAIDALVSKARADKNDVLFARLALAGCVQKPLDGDLPRLIRGSGAAAADPIEHEYYGEPNMTTAMSISPLLLEWAGDTPDPAVVAMISSTTRSGVTAAAVADFKWKLPQARQALIQTLTRRPRASRSGGLLSLIGLGSSRSSSSPQERQLKTLASSTLSITGDGETAKALLASCTADDSDSDRLRESMVLFQAAATVDPNAAFEWLKNSGARNDRLWYVARGILPSVADDAKVDMQDDSPIRYMQSSFSSVLMNLRQNAAQTQPASGAATSQADDNSLQPDDGTAVRFLMPPWNESRDKALVHRTTEEVHEQLAGLIRNISDPKLGADVRKALMLRQGMVSEDYSIRQMIGLVRDGVISQEDVEGLQGAEMYYLRSLSEPGDAVATLLPPAEIAEALAPMFSAQATSVRTFAMRQAARWQLTALRGQVAAGLDRKEPVEIIEAAWALAILDSDKAIEPIARAYAQQKDFDLRVHLACLLRMMGSSAGDADIARAQELKTLLSARAAVIAASMPQPTDRDEDDDMRELVYRRMMHMRRGYERPDAPSAALPSWADSLSRFQDAPTRDRDGESADEPATVPPAVCSDLSEMSFQGSSLLAPKLRDNGLPLEGLSGGSSYSSETVFQRPCLLEQHLEPSFYVQFADRARNGAELFDLWRAWWRDNRTATPAQWWRQGLEQAVAELTHPRWWHRMRASARLMRLSGRWVDPPSLFDMNAWRQLQRQWRRRLEEPAFADRRSCLLQAAIEAGALPREALAHATADEQYLADLVRLAGWAPQPLATAAVMQLQTRPDRDQLLRATLAWQRCPRFELVKWTRLVLSQRTRATRLFYTREQL
ncbi:MAG: HEAT repeat domain-containing protein [Planctomycetaceae bacterium]|nr:HEAT repeat domain-containing protein [Planctomycetaceae bacterium]